MPPDLAPANRLRRAMSSAGVGGPLWPSSLTVADPLCSSEQERSVSPSVGPHGRNTEEAPGIVALATTPTKETPATAERPEGSLVASPPKPCAMEVPPVQVASAMPTLGSEAASAVATGAAPEAEAALEVTDEATPEAETAAEPMVWLVPGEAPQPAAEALPTRLE